MIKVDTHSEPKPTTGWRRDMWHTHMEKLHNLVSRFEKKGYPVIGFCSDHDSVAVKYTIKG